MTSPSYSQASQLSYCDPKDSGPLLDSLVTDELTPRLVAAVNRTQCQRVAFVRAADQPAIAFVGSGGPLLNQPVRWGASVDLEFSTMGAAIELSGDLVRQVPGILDAQSRLLSVLIGQFLGSKNFAEPFESNYRNIPWFAGQNPAGVMLPTAGPGEPPVVPDLLGLRRRIVPHGSDNSLVFVMHSRAFEALEVQAALTDRPIDYRLRPDGSAYAPYVGPSEVLLCDHIPTDEGETPDMTSIYAVRIRDERQPVGVEGLAIVTPPGRPGIEVGPMTAIEGRDQFQVVVKGDFLLSGGRGSVARLAQVDITGAP